MRLLCDRHLLGEHRELHAIWTLQTEGKRGYARHPETLRWRGRLAALYARQRPRSSRWAARIPHASALDGVHATGETTQSEFVDPREVRLERLAQLGCGCVRSRTAGGGVRSGSPSDDVVSRAIRAQHRK